MSEDPTLKFRVFEPPQMPRSPCCWRLLGLFESPLVIAAHLSPDPARFHLDEAKRTLFDWLGALEQVARSTDVARPVVGCLEVKNQTLRRAFENAENEAMWQGNGIVLYVEGTPEDSVKRLHRLLFRTVDLVDLDRFQLDMTQKRLEKFRDATLDDSYERNLFSGLLRLFNRHAGGARRPLSEEAREVTRSWVEQPTKVPEVPLTREVPRTPQSPNEAQPLPRLSIGRIRKVEVENFRGWCGRHALDTDADLVLLTGPNGHGKSTLLEALALTLTGYSRHQPLEKLLSFSPNGIGKAAAVSLQTDAEGGPLTVRLVASAEEPDSSTTTTTSGSALSIGDLELSPLWHWFNGRTRDPLAASAREAELSAVFGPDLHARFDPKEGSTRLLSVFAAGGLELGELEKGLSKEQEELKSRLLDRRTRLDHLRDPAENEKTRDALVVAFWRMHPLYLPLVDFHREYGGTSALPQWNEPPESADEGLAHVQEFAAALAGAFGVRSDRVLDEIKKVIDRWQDREREQAKPELYRKHLSLLREAAELKERFPQARERSQVFVDPDGGPSLDQCLDSLARNLVKWRQASERAELRFLAEQLGRVIPDDLVRLRDHAKQNIAEWRRASDRMERVGQEIEELRRKLESGTRFSQLELLKKTPLFKDFWEAVLEREAYQKQVADGSQLEEEVRRMAEISQALDLAIGEIKTTELQELLRETFERGLNDVIARVHLPSELLPIRLDRNGRVLLGPDRGTRDGLQIDELSTGQRTQLEVALAVAINLTLSSELGSKVLLMDDVSAAYDAANIAREATFWRAVAYGHVEGDPKEEPQRRQLFLSSHNESTSRHLIDLLRPPEGATMKVIRFLGWTLERGPVFRIDDVRSSSPSTPQSRQRLARGITESLGERS